MSNDLIVPPDFPDFDVIKGGQTIPKPTFMNTVVALENKLGLTCRFDMFHGVYSIEGNVLAEKMGELDDPGLRLLRQLIRVACDFEPSEKTMAQAAKRACEMHAFHPIKDYLESVEWDQTKRLDTWLIDYMGAEDNPFNRAVGRLVLIASVKRIYQPGIKYDYITVLVSPEGMNKSRSIALMYGDENFTDQSIIGLNPREVEEVMRGNWGVECPELSGIGKADWNKLRAQLSRRVDRVRRVYDLMPVNAARTAVIWGTCNPEQADFLRSLSGENRRFFPVIVKLIDYDKLKADRDQLWAEAFHEAQGVTDLSLPEEVWPDAAKAREAHTQTDPWVNMLRDAPRTVADAYGVRGHLCGQGSHCEAYQCDESGERLAVSAIYDAVLKIPPERRSTEHERRVGLIMRKLGWTLKPTVRIGNRPVRGWVRPPVWT